jgi:ABC-type uncharacterized transport system substrate-binding protein
MLDMRRRTFITLLGGTAAAWPIGARAQRAAKVPRIGYIVTGSRDSPDQRVMLDAFHEGLRKRGYVEGQNISVEYRAADGKIERFPELARQLVALNPDLIWAPNTPAARAAKQATATIPIVVPVMGDPVSDGLVVSLARPGGNVTGMTFLGPELVAKRLELLKQALPTISRVAALWHPGAYGETTMGDMMRNVEAAARSLRCGSSSLRYGRRPSSNARPRSCTRSAPMHSSSCQARCYSAGEHKSSILPPGIGCPRSRWRESSWSLVAFWLTGRASLI